MRSHEEMGFYPTSINSELAKVSLATMNYCAQSLVLLLSFERAIFSGDYLEVLPLCFPYSLKTPLGPNDLRLSLIIVLNMRRKEEKEY